MDRWDLVVIGGGSAGLIGARTAAGLGARVVLVEEARTGGECLYTGCVPSKALLAAAGEGLGFDAAMERIRGAIAAIEPQDAPETLERLGIRVIQGHAALQADGTVTVAGERLSSRAVLVATGASAARPALAGLDPLGLPESVLTTDSVWDLPALPPRLAVVGGGPAGCELTQAFARLGSEVTLVAPRILPGEDPEAADVLRKALERDGVRILSGDRAVEVRVDGVRADGQSGLLRTEAGAEVAFTHLLLAVGRSPRSSGLGLETAGVEVDGSGAIVTDESLRTTNPRVWAAGDVTDRGGHTHTAGVHAALAAANAVLGLTRRVSPVRPPRVTFTSPEVGSVGETTAGSGTRTVTIPHSHVDRAITEGDTSGFTRVVLDRRGRIRGGTVAGPRAGEVLGELSLAVHARLRATDLAGAVHAYTTHADALWAAGLQARLTGLKAPVPRAAVGLLLRLGRLRGRQG